MAARPYMFTVQIDYGLQDVAQYFCKATYRVGIPIYDTSKALLTSAIYWIWALARV